METPTTSSLTPNSSQRKPRLQRSTKGFLIVMAVSIMAGALAVPLMLHDWGTVGVGAFVGLFAGFILGLIAAGILKKPQAAGTTSNMTVPNTTVSLPDAPIAQPSQSLPLSYSLLGVVLAINQICLLLVAARIGIMGFKALLNEALSLEDVFILVLVLGLFGLVVLARTMIAQGRGVSLWAAILGIVSALDLAHRAYSRAIYPYQPDTPCYVDIIGGGLDLLTLCAAIAAFWTSTLVVRKDAFPTSTLGNKNPSQQGENIFSYTARTHKGEKVCGQIIAKDRKSALVSLEQKGLVPISLQFQPKGVGDEAVNTSTRTNQSIKS